MGKNSRFLALWISVLVFETAIVDRSFAQSPTNVPAVGSDSSADAAYDAAFQQMLRDPGNFDKTFRYAQLAEKAGDLEGAIGAYSRLLITIPEYWQVRYELAVLYFRLKSYALSKSYFSTALKNKQMPPAIRERVAKFMIEIDKQLAQHRFSGSLSLGIRYQTNINAGSGTSSNAVGAAQIDFVEKDDTDLFGALDVEYVYDFNRVEGTVWQSHAQIYGAKQKEETEFDLIFIDASSGPRFQLGQEEFAGLSAQPHLILEYVRLGNSTLSNGFGGGLQLEKLIGDDVLTKLGYDVRDRTYRNNARRPNSTNLNGLNHAVKAELLYTVTPSFGTNFELRYGVLNARKSFESNQEISLLVGGNLSHAAPFGVSEEPWLSGITIKHARADYNEANPSVDPSKARDSRRWLLRHATSVPLSNKLSATISAGYTHANSNITVYDYENIDVFLALSYRF